MDHSRTLLLFDVDGTLTRPRLPITDDMDHFLAELRTIGLTIGLVGGSDLKKIAEQMQSKQDQDPSSNENSDSKSTAIEQLIRKYSYVFAENGLIAYESGALIGERNIVDEIGEQKLQRFINFCLRYLSDVELPCKRGTFVEFRTGMINVSPVGRSCTQAEREQFAAFDAQNRVRERMIEALRREFPADQYGLCFAIGGQISVDCFPCGWDKTYCLRFVEQKYDRIFFFGDKTEPGCNDHEIFAHERTIGHAVRDYQHTKQLLTELFFNK